MTSRQRRILLKAGRLLGKQVQLFNRSIQGSPGVLPLIEAVPPASAPQLRRIALDIRAMASELASCLAAGEEEKP